MTLKLQGQPNNMTCGQTSVAMVAGISVEESIKLFGHNHASRVHDYERVLKMLGIKYGAYTKVDNRRKVVLPNLCLVRLDRIGARTGHLIAYKDGVFYDPANGGRTFNGIDELMRAYNPYKRRWRIQYYMEILGKGEAQAKSEEVLQMVAGDKAKRYKVRVSHDMFKKGYKQYLEREISVEELSNLKKSTTFTIESYEVIGE